MLGQPSGSLSRRSITSRPGHSGLSPVTSQQPQTATPQGQWALPPQPRARRVTTGGTMLMVTGSPASLSEEAPSSSVGDRWSPRLGQSTPPLRPPSAARAGPPRGTRRAGGRWPPGSLRLVVGRHSRARRGVRGDFGFQPVEVSRSDFGVKHRGRIPDEEVEPITQPRLVRVVWYPAAVHPPHRSRLIAHQDSSAATSWIEPLRYAEVHPHQAGRCPKT